MTGGGNNLKKRAKSKSYLSKTLKITKFVSKKLEDFHSAISGSILIEFAVCMPVLIILLYYINDLSKLKRYYDQTEFTAQQFVNIIQNISQNREIKTISENDIIHACCLAYLNIYPGTSMFYNGTGYGLCHRPELFMTYVVGNPDGTASCKWLLHLPTRARTSPAAYVVEKGTKAHDGSSLNFQINVAPTIIHPQLKINPGEKKIIVESSILFKSSYAYSNGYKPGTAKKAFGYFLLNPKPTTRKKGDIQEWYYHSVQIFTPKSGLFDETPPQK